MTHALQTKSVSLDIGAARIVEDVSLTVDYGNVLALVGPNGAGKSTLLSLLTGDRAPTAGEVLMDGQPVLSISPKQRARKRAVLTQENTVSFPFMVRDVVDMGRAPWRSRPEERNDVAVVMESLELMDISDLGHRTFTSLSGGEKARVSLARVLAQSTDIVLLDEPTAALDLRHQEDIMKVARDLAKRDKAVVVVLHDLALAAAYADFVAVMSHGRLAHYGTAAQVMTPANLEDVYGIGVRVIADPDSGSPIILPVRGAR